MLSVLDMEKRRLRHHIGLGPTPNDPPARSPPEPQPLFFIEMAPDSKQGAKCKLDSCIERIMPGELRLAVSPASGPGGGSKSSADLYHIRCFEHLADFSDAAFLDRISPMDRQTWKLRGVPAEGILEGNYLVPGAVERLVLEWKVTIGRWIDIRDGTYDEAQAEAEWSAHADFRALLRKAGSSEYKENTPAGLPVAEYHNLLTTLAPFESDGPGDTKEWNLFDTYLDSSVEALNDPRSLSKMLQRWHDDTKLAIKRENELDEQGRAAKAALGGKAVRALKRMSAVTMPQIPF